MYSSTRCEISRTDEERQVRFRRGIKEIYEVDTLNKRGDTLGVDVHIFPSGVIKFIGDVEISDIIAMRRIAFYNPDNEYLLTFDGKPVSDAFVKPFGIKVRC